MEFTEGSLMLTNLSDIYVHTNAKMDVLLDKSNRRQIFPLTREIILSKRRTG